MPQTILLAGTILASSLGCALTILAVTSAIRQAKPCQNEERWLERDLDPDVCEYCYDAFVVRGYDSPDVYREDCAARLYHSIKDRTSH